MVEERVIEGGREKRKRAKYDERNDRYAGYDNADFRHTISRWNRAEAERRKLKEEEV